MFEQSFPDDGSVYDYCYSAVERRWKKWMDTVIQDPISPIATFSSIVVPTKVSSASLIQPSFST